MAYQTVTKAYKTYNGVAYDLQYDTTNGKVQLIQQNATSTTQPIFSDGKWNSSAATSLGISSADQKSIYNQIQGTIKDAYTKAGGNSAGAQIPPWAVNGNDGSEPGQTNPTLPTQPSQNSQGNPSNPIEGISQLFNSITNPAEAFSQISVANGGYGPANEKEAIGGTHMYPTDMQIKYQDYLYISQYKYNAPAASALLKGDVNALVNQGFQKDLNFRSEEVIGHVYLPMPNGFNEQLEAGWNSDEFNNLSAAALAHAMGNVPGYGAAMGLGAAVNKATGGGAGQGAQFAVKGMQAAAYAGAIASGGTNESRSAVSAAVLEQILAQGFFAADADSILSRTAGVVANNNMEFMFQGPKLRGISFSYTMTARDSNEAKVIRKILRFFKQGSRPKKKTGGAGQASYFLATPNVFRLKFCLGGGAENPAVAKFKTCACTGVEVNYNAASGGSGWVAYEDGQPLAVTMTLAFTELEPIFDTDYQEDLFLKDPKNIITGVSNDAVGY